MNLHTAEMRKSLSTTIGIAVAFGADMPDAYFDAMGIGKMDSTIAKYRYKASKSKLDNTRNEMRRSGNIR